MIDAVLDIADTARREINGDLSDTRAMLGQYMTPAAVASFMAGMFNTRRRHLRVLDPGAGVGSLSAALVDRLLARKSPPASISLTCFEVDTRLMGRLRRTLDACSKQCKKQGISLTADIRHEDYIESRSRVNHSLFSDDHDRFDCVVMNPPYRKINSNSEHRRLLRAAGIETTNLYSAFMLLAARELAEGGEFVSISPRSFCNGTYFRPFRRELLQLLDIRRLHVFESRTDAFRDDDVLQENVIVYGVRGCRQRPEIRVSVTDRDRQIRRRTVSFEQIVCPHDHEAIIHIVTDGDADEITRRMAQLATRLKDLGVSVSTGRVVDFRARQYLQPEVDGQSVPLIYANHLHAGRVKWPNSQSRKANAIVRCDYTESLLVPKGSYVLTKRFSAKEERRRVVAAIFDPKSISSPVVGFDNKTNYFHARGKGIDEDLARGLTVYLNSTIVDRYFRLFSGHTQVNAADLRRLPYPNKSQLRSIGKRVKDLGNQGEIDAAVRCLF